MSKRPSPDTNPTASVWYEDFFRGLAVELCRKAIPPEQTRAEVDFLEKALKAPQGGHLLSLVHLA